jgi:16S rRNA (uracil1498-N3)-methyltransferase
MRHRIFVEAISPRVTVEGEEFHHSVRVVRVRQGEEVELFDRSGRAARGVVEALGRDRAEVVVTEDIPSRESPLVTHLAMAIIQLEKFELVLQKATELGVHSIIPLETEHVEVRRERYAGKSERWEKIVFEAVKQSGRSVAPALAAPQTFADIVARPGVKVLLDAAGTRDVLDDAPQEITLLIGPEGGWSDAELASARRHGLFFRSLGPRRLRAETAAIAALSVIASTFGDL